MVNGLYGSSADWRFAAEQFVKRLPGKVYVHRSECNHSKLTYDGVDIMGERLAEEVHQVVQRKRNLRKISVVAHSLGGLISRYAIGRLYEESTSEEPCLNMEKHSDQESMCRGGKIAGLEPMNFIASATPHLGSRWNKQLPFLFGVPLLEQTAAETAHLIVGRTGKHLFLSDRDDGKPPLLVRMVEDGDDGKFIALNFEKDIVGWSTSSIRRQHELPKLELEANNEKYPHVIHVDTANSEGTQQEDSVDTSLTDSPEEHVQLLKTNRVLSADNVCFVSGKGGDEQNLWPSANSAGNGKHSLSPPLAIFHGSNEGTLGELQESVGVETLGRRDSQNALKYATETLVHRGQSLVLKWAAPTPPQATRADSTVTPTLQPQENFIMSPFSRGPTTTSARKFPDFSQTESSDISFIGAPTQRRSVDRSGGASSPPRLSTGSDTYEHNSFEAPRSGWGLDTFGSESTSNSHTSVSSSLPAEDMEAEMRRLRLELKQTMDMYSTACKEALTAKQKATELQRWKEEEQRSQDGRLTEETALALIEQEKAKARAAIEAAEAMR
ncbi:hypothetical protein TRIUR3_14236 [Triticum urartu]|uniref:Uncharacterized protein n=1 Tax=Triticum urartu TaxID=4572 RepID=M7ZNA1_TRIUA|nr:hypothetical protein TRIUR3_14236 [Triticum urartu]